MLGLPDFSLFDEDVQKIFDDFFGEFSFVDFDDLWVLLGNWVTLSTGNSSLSFLTSHRKSSLDLLTSHFSFFIVRVNIL